MLTELNDAQTKIMELEQSSAATRDTLSKELHSTKLNLSEALDDTDSASTEIKSLKRQLQTLEEVTILFDEFTVGVSKYFIYTIVKQKCCS